MKLDVRNPSELIPHPKNPKTHTEKQIEHIANSIERFGWTQPVVVDEADVILIGHGRARAALKLKQDALVYKMEGLTEAQKIALLAFDNTSNLETGFDPVKMEDIFHHLEEMKYEMERFGLGSSVVGDTGADRAEDENTLGEAYKKYAAGEVKQLVLIFSPEDYKSVVERVQKVMEQDEYPTKAAMMQGLIREWEKERGML